MNPHAPDTPEDADAPPLAAEFVLGLVQGEERDKLARRLRDDHVFARDVEFWEARLGPLAGNLAADVPPHVWQNIAQAVGHKPVPLSASSAVDAQSGLWNSVPFWRRFGFASSTLAAACIVFMLHGNPRPPPDLIATLQLTNGTSVIMASLDRMTGRVTLMPAANMPTPPEQTYELWLVPANGTPQSLGTFVADRPRAMLMPENMMQHAGADATLAVSLEPMGGSTTGQPTGAIVAKGELDEL
jgi:anti-sigma-K factor RskA